MTTCIRQHCDREAKFVVGHLLTRQRRVCAGHLPGAVREVSEQASVMMRCGPQVASVAPLLLAGLK